MLNRKRIKRFSDHEVHTVPGLGWSGKKNGELLRAMIAYGIEVFITADQNLRFQQNLSNTPVAIVVICAATNRIADLIPLIPKTLLLLTKIQPGQVVEITGE